MNQLIPRIEFLLQSIFRKQLYCPHCGSHEIQKIAKKYGLIRIEKCTECGLFFTSPIYKPLLFPELYDKLYKAEGSTTEMPTSKNLMSLKDREFNGSDKYFGDRIQAIAHYTKGRNLLEIGSSWGYFLYQAQLHGFNATGIELSDTRRKYGIDNLKVNVFKDIDDVKSKKFDLIYSSHTLEHFTDISTIFSKLSNCLKVGGKLILEVPNFDWLFIGESILPIIGAVHPLGFSSDFFQQNLPEYGFKIVAFYNSWSDFPDQKAVKSQGDVILLLAEKVTGSNDE